MMCKLTAENRDHGKRISYRRNIRSQQRIVLRGQCSTEGHLLFKKEPNLGKLCNMYGRKKIKK